MRGEVSTSSSSHLSGNEYKKSELDWSEMSKWIFFSGESSAHDDDIIMAISWDFSETRCLRVFFTVGSLPGAYHAKENTQRHIILSEPFSTNVYKREKWEREGKCVRLSFNFSRFSFSLSLSHTKELPASSSFCGLCMWKKYAYR